MRAGICLCLVAVLAFGAGAYGQSFIWEPIDPGADATGLSTCAGCVVSGSDITCPAGGCRVRLDVFAEGWSNYLYCEDGTAPCDVDNPCGTGAACVPSDLGAVQVTVDGVNSYVSGLGGALVPYQFAGNKEDGGFQILNTCLDGTTLCGDPAESPFSSCSSICTPAFGIAYQPFVHSCCNPIAAVSRASLNYSWGSTPQSGATVEGPDYHNAYVGTLILELPANAKGVYTISTLENADLSFMNDTFTNNIPLDPVYPTATITIPTGKCCSGIGAGTPVCTSGLTEGECNLLPGPIRLFEAGASCIEEGPDTNGNDCIECTNVGPNPTECGDGDACTSDVCLPDLTCENAPNYDDATQCCDPANGDLTIIDDGDQCTDDVCEADGSVSHPPSSTSTTCDDNNACTIDDFCDGAGACVGDDVNAIACLDDAECAGLPGSQACVDGFCECKLETEVCVDLDGGCYEDGALIDGTVHIGSGSEIVTGGQFSLSWDPACMSLVDIGPCMGSNFDTIIAKQIDNELGTAFYAVTLPPFGGLAGQTSNFDIACLTYEFHGDCDGCCVALGGENPTWTILSSDTGNRIGLDICECSETVRLAGDIDLDVPGDVQTNADCNVRYATETWDAPSATDTCDGALEVTCQSDHTEGADVSGMIMGGGDFPQGTSFFICEATNSCGETVSKVWTVQVSDEQTLDVEVQLSPEMYDGVFDRAITFELYEDCQSEPLEHCEVLSFNGPYNFQGHATAELKVGKGQYFCITARDCLHTLRSAAQIECGEDGQWSAIFKGDPLLGGNWLVGGNLDGCKAGIGFADANTINILDFGVFANQVGAGGAVGDTDCETPHPHADINGDGLLDDADYSFLIENFLEASKDACCPSQLASWEPNLLTEISVKELRSRGLGDLAAGDLNADGWLNMDDMALWMQGVRPVDNSRVKRSSGRSAK